MEQMKLFDDKLKKIIEDGIEFLQMDVADAKVLDPIIEKESWTANTSSLTCSYCRVEFLDSLQHREHYKLDWHRYNLKQHLLYKHPQPLSEEEFNQKTDDISSISGSESEKEDGLENYAVAQGKIFLKTKEGKVFPIYKCLLFDKKDDLEDEILVQRLRDCTTNSRWTVLMLGGGHFAGGIFQGSVPILHKTFHCYTVRAGQGGSQGARDNRSGGSQPKSAGASLRRYNETALIQHVKNIVEAWKEEIAKSSLIIYRAAGAYNKSILFGGKTPILNRSDSRLLTIPFSTRRATFTELKRVHNLLSTVCIYESSEVALQQLPKRQTAELLSKHNRTNKDRSKSRESIERPLPTIPSSSSESNSDCNQIELTTGELEISFKNVLESFEDTLTPEERSKGRKIWRSRKTKNQRVKKRELLRKAELYKIAQTGDIEKLKLFIEVDDKIDNAEQLKHQTNDIQLSFLNEGLDERGNSLLHIAAIYERSDMVKFLLGCNADPCIRNDKLQTPYTCTQNKDVRGAFKNFAQEFPDKHNYNKAQIPMTQLTLEEQLEKKKAQKKLKREKEKEKKKQNDIKQKEELEKERFLNLSDREKRALAAERRILNQSGAVIARCFLCASDISGQVPFEYSNYRFCSVVCLKAHRLKNSTLLPQ